MYETSETSVRHGSDCAEAPSCTCSMSVLVSCRCHNAAVTQSRRRSGEANGKRFSVLVAALLSRDFLLRPDSVAKLFSRGGGDYRMS